VQQLLHEYVGLHQEGLEPLAWVGVPSVELFPSGFGDFALADPALDLVGRILRDLDARFDELEAGCYDDDCVSLQVFGDPTPLRLIQGGLELYAQFVGGFDVGLGDDGRLLRHGLVLSAKGIGQWFGIGQSAGVAS
jgi:hypothetical protein